MRNFNYKKFIIYGLLYLTPQLELLAFELPNNLLSTQNLFDRAVQPIKEQLATFQQNSVRLNLADQRQLVADLSAPQIFFSRLCTQDWELTKRTTRLPKQVEDQFVFACDGQPLVMLTFITNSLASVELRSLMSGLWPQTHELSRLVLSFEGLLEINFDFDFKKDQNLHARSQFSNQLVTDDKNYFSITVSDSFNHRPIWELSILQQITEASSRNKINGHLRARRTELTLIDFLTHPQILTRFTVDDLYFDSYQQILFYEQFDRISESRFTTGFVDPLLNRISQILLPFFGPDQL